MKEIIDRGKKDSRFGWAALPPDDLKRLADSHAALQSQVRAFSEDRDALRVAIDAALNGLREDTIAAASHTRYPTDCQHPYCVLSRARSSLRSEGEPDT